MIDVVDPETRSRMMAGITGKDTKPEIILRRALHARGFRFRLHQRQLPGRPDVVLPKYHAAIFVHGCFWHRHPGCRFATTPATRPEFWAEKFADTVKRDKRNLEALQAAGWRAAVVWECALSRNEMEAAINRIVKWLSSDEQFIDVE